MDVINVANKMPDTSTRVLWADLIRVVAIFAVIVLHIAAVPVTKFKTIPQSQWWWANGYDAVVRPCIPLFVMLSGALLLPRPTWHVSQFIRRRIARVVIPFGAWSLIYAGWNYLFHGQPMSPAEFVRHLIGGMSNPVSTHLWYLPLILSLYLLIPILRVYVVDASLANQAYFAGLWLAASTVRPLLEARLGLTIGVYLDPVFGYVGYFVLGATLSHAVLSRLPTPWLRGCGSAFLCGLVSTAMGTYVLTVRHSGDLDEYLYSHFSPTVIVMSLSAFVLLRHLGVRLQDGTAATALSGRLLAFASKASFGTYLVHMIVLELLTSGVLGFALGPLVFHPALAIPVSSLVVFLASLAVAASMQQFRLLRWLVP